jgi:hypothetical protein
MASLPMRQPKFCPQYWNRTLLSILHSPSSKALVGCQGRGGADGVPPDFRPALLLTTLLFEEPSKEVVLLGPRGSLRPRHPRRASSFFLVTLVLSLSRARVGTPYPQGCASDAYPLFRAWEPHDRHPATHAERPWRGPGARGRESGCAAAWRCVCGVTRAPPAWRQRHSCCRQRAG